MSRHPYDGAAVHRRWSRAVAAARDGVDPVVGWPWRLSRTDKVAAAGSCFAQHVARYLRGAGFAFLDVEPVHPVLGREIGEAFGYGVYSARFGNIYTARQLLQLFERAYGRLTPQEDRWVEADGRLIDPFRPNIQPGGYPSSQEFELDRARHLAAVREMFETLDVFVFTLGLTETWVSTEDGAVFPLCPGVAGGRFDPARHVFDNPGVEEIVADLNAFLDGLAGVNPRARTILTVSPVPLAATATDEHVLTATVRSKSVLRAAADAIVRRRGDVAYFPSYEIVTGPQARGRYFADDLRSVTEEGVAAVMRVFFRHVAGEEMEAAPAPAAPEGEDAFKAQARQAVQAMCDEEMLDRDAAAAGA